MSFFEPAWPWDLMQATARQLVGKCIAFAHCEATLVAVAAFAALFAGTRKLRAQTYPFPISQALQRYSRFRIAMHAFSFVVLKVE